MRQSRRRAGPILFATDFLKPAQRAFGYALTLANLLPAHLVILHVIKAVAGEGSSGPSDSRRLKSMKTAALLEVGRLTRLAQESGIPAEPMVQVGHPTACVVDAMTSLTAQAVVMGTHGRTGWDRLRLGSTADSLIREASCPVMTVQGVVAGDGARRYGRGRLTRLLVATDFSATSLDAIRYAFELVRRVDGQLVVLHVVDSSEGDGLHAERVERLRASRERRLRRVLFPLEATGLAIKRVSVVGSPIEVILKQAAGWRADAIVIGTRGRRGLDRLMLSSLAGQVVRRAGCPVLTVNRSAGQAVSADHTISGASPAS